MKKVIVIGTGILGATAAYQLAKNGAEVIAIDRNDDGRATDAAAGIICPWISQRRNKAWYQLASDGARYYPELIVELKQNGEKDIGYEKVGVLGLHTDDQKLEATRKRVLKRRENSPEIGDVALLNETETQAMFPLLDDRYKSIHVSGAARVNGQSLRRSLLNGAQQYGATLIKGSAQLLHKENSVIGVTVNGTEYHADKVIATTGAWLNELLQPLNIDIDVYPQKAQIIELQLDNVDTDRLPIVMPPNNQYIIPFKDGKVIIGATIETTAGFDKRVTAGGVHEILTKALEVVPNLANAKIVETKTGFRPVANGAIPIVGRVPNVDGLLLANGLGATGLTIGPYVGSQLAKLALGKETSIELSNYDIATVLK